LVSESSAVLTPGLTKDVVKFIIQSGILDEKVSQKKRKRTREDDAKAKKGKDSEIDYWRYDLLEEGLSHFDWPSNVGRLPPSVVSRTVTSGTPVLKGDEWNHLRAVLPSALWVALRDPGTDQITPGYDEVTNKRNDLYRATVNFCAAVRILCLRTVTLEQVCQAQVTLAQVAKDFLELGMRMVPNWHIAMHFARAISHFGPIGSFSTWAYERHNGLLARSRYFKGGTAQMTTTAARHWLKAQLLRAVLENPAPDIQPDEAEYYETVMKILDKETAQGTLLAETAVARSGQQRLSLPNPSATKFNLRSIEGLYAETLTYVKETLELPVVDDADMFSPDQIMFAAGHEQFPHVQMTGYK
jgi:hypothetical protein